MTPHDGQVPGGPAYALRGVLAALSLVCLLCTSLAFSATNELLYEQALKLLKSGKDNARAVRMFEDAATDGDVRSILMLGAILLEGKYVAQERAKGFAYLQIASQTTYPPYKPIREQALKWMQSSESLLSGGELIRADQIASEWEAAFLRRLAAQYEPAIAVFTDEKAVSFDPMIRFAKNPVTIKAGVEGADGPRFRSGCAARSRPGCPPASRQLPESRCTGEIVAADTGPNAVAALGAQLVAPDFPDGVRNDGDSGITKALVHVDRSGWVCGTVLAVSSGVPSMDAAALDAVGLWRLNPAMKGGQPVEALHMLAVSFYISD